MLAPSAVFCDQELEKFKFGRPVLLLLLLSTPLADAPAGTACVGLELLPADRVGGERTWLLIPRGRLSKDITLLLAEDSALGENGMRLGNFIA